MTGTATEGSGGGFEAYRDLEEYVKKLERQRLEAVARHRLQEAEALEKVVVAARQAGEFIGPALPIEAKAKRAYAEEFFKAIRELDEQEGGTEAS